MKLLTRIFLTAEEYIAYCAMTVLVSSVLWGVLTRYVTEKPAVWTTELSGIVFTWVVCLGAMAAFRRNQHIRVTLLVDELPPLAGNIVRFIANIAILLFLLSVTYYSYEMMLKGASRPSPVLRIPFSYVYLASLIAFGIMSITCLLQILGFAKNTDDGQTVQDVV
jgi:TRAP-type C4-dicarboxylate transport system permease small subunit